MSTRKPITQNELRLLWIGHGNDALTREQKIIICKATGYENYFTMAVCGQWEMWTPAIIYSLLRVINKSPKKYRTKSRPMHQDDLFKVDETIKPINKQSIALHKAHSEKRLNNYIKIHNLPGKVDK